MVFFFEPANITNQILNFGLPAPIDLQVVGRDASEQFQNRAEVARQIAAFPAPPTCTSTRYDEQPQLNLNVDRVKAGQLGLTQRDVSSSMLISLSWSRPGRSELLA